MIEQAGRRREIAAPAWFNFLIGVDVSRDGRRMGYSGWNKATFDTVAIDVTPVDSFAPVRWFAGFAEDGGGMFLPDGSLLVRVYATQLSVALYHLRAPGRAESLGEIPRPAASVFVSQDLRRAVVNTRDYHGDAWLSRVVRP